MGQVYANIQVGNQDNSEMVDMDEVLVDTGALHSMFPVQLLEDIRISPDGYDEVEYANGATEIVPVGYARIRIKGYETSRVCPVYFSNSGQRIIGATTLETLRIMVDPVEYGLVKKPPIKARQF